MLVDPYVNTVIFMMGINDIGWPDMALDPTAEQPTADDIIAGYEQLIARAHDYGIRINGATLTPFNNAFGSSPLAGYSNEDEEATHVEVNEWIRTSDAFDGVIDFDAVVQDPDNPNEVLLEYNKGDDLHPNDAGYEAMANAIDLSLIAP